MGVETLFKWIIIGLIVVFALSVVASIVGLGGIFTGWGQTAFDGGVGVSPAGTSMSHVQPRTNDVGATFAPMDVAWSVMALLDPSPNLAHGGWFTGALVSFIALVGTVIGLKFLLKLNG